jgi:hypothetical protein
MPENEDKDRDEPVKLGLDPKTALKGQLKVDPEAQPSGNKEHKLDWIRKAPSDELAIPEVRDELVQEARDAGATQDEIDAALDALG